MLPLGFNGNSVFEVHIKDMLMVYMSTLDPLNDPMIYVHVLCILVTSIIKLEI
jgi:hypothetical protein